MSEKIMNGEDISGAQAEAAVPGGLPLLDDAYRKRIAEVPCTASAEYRASHAVIAELECRERQLREALATPRPVQETMAWAEGYQSAIDRRRKMDSFYSARPAAKDAVAELFRRVQISLEEFANYLDAKNCPLIAAEIRKEAGEIAAHTRVAEQVSA